MKGIRDCFGLRMVAALAVAVATLLGTGGCRREAGTEDGFEYTAGLFSAELEGLAKETQKGETPIHLEVPKRLGGKRVRSVAAGTFRNCTNAISIKIPPKVSRIGAEAFAECTNLVWAELPSHLARLEDGLFSNCRSMAESDIPDRVKEIGARTYQGCARLKRVAFPEKLRSVGPLAFSGCTSLRTLDLPADLESIGDGVFAGCRSLEHLELPPGIPDIPDGAFENCSGLRSVRLPTGITNIGARAFAGCVSLERIELPPGLRSVGAEAFAGCALLERVELPAAVRSVGKRAFADCRKLREIAVDGGNGSYKSSGGALLTKDGAALLAFPAGLGGTFAVPDGIQAVGDEAFATCGLLESLSIPASVERIGARAFAGCTGLKSVDVAQDNPAFGSRDGVLFGTGGTELLLFPGARDGTYKVPDGVKRIAPDAFRGSRVERVAVPGGVESIGASAFRDCQRLRRVELAEGVAELGDAAFAGCSALWVFTMPASVVRAGAGLFAGCGELGVLVVPCPPMREISQAEAWQVAPDCAIYDPAGWDAERRKWRGVAARDPFFGLYEGEDLDTVSFEGTVLAASTVPDPARNDYDDCLVALLVEIESVQSSAPPSEEIERVVLVNAPIMKDKAVIQANRFGPGDRISCLCADYDAMPQEIREIQLSDDIQSFEHRQYYALDIERTGNFQPTGHRDFAKKEITVLPIQTLPRDSGAAAARRARIREEIARIEGELEKHGGSFEAWKEEYRPVADEYGRLCAEHYKGWIHDSYFAAGGAETTYETEQYIAGLLPYKKHLEKNNIDLIVLRVPTKWDFAARVLAAGDFRENPAWVEHCYECLKNDIEIVDPMPAMWEARFDFPLFYFYNVPEEFHPFEGMSFVAARQLAEVLERYPYRKSGQEIVLTNAVFETGQERFFWPAGNGKFDPAENIAFRQVFRDGKTIGGLWERSDSPFLFLSNSYFWYPQRLLGASIPGYTAYFLQAIPDWVYQDGATSPLIKYLFSYPNILDARRAVVMVGDPNGWKGFPPIPKYIQDGAKRLTLEKTLLPTSDEVTIHDTDSLLHSTNANGTVLFVKYDMPPDDQRPRQFGLEFKIPCMEGKRACMIRVNIAKTSYITVDLLEHGSGSTLDTCFLPPGREQAVDFCVSLPNPAPTARILFRPRYPQQECFVKNIELWYY